MARIAKRKLKEQHRRELYTQLADTVGTLTAAQADSFLSELLGPEEKIMIAKRLAIIVMINERYSLYRIAETLCVSSATAEKIKARHETGAYTHVVTLLQKNKKGYLSILQTIDSILHLGGILPHYGDTRLRL